MKFQDKEKWGEKRNIRNKVKTHPSKLRQFKLQSIWKCALRKFQWNLLALI